MTASPDQKLRILHVLRAVRLEEGGVVRAVLDMCAELARWGHAVKLATFDVTDVPPQWKQEPGYPGIVLLSEKVKSAKSLRSLVREYDVVHLHTPWDQLNPHLARQCRRSSTPYVISIHGMLDDWSMSQKALKKRVYWWTVARRLLGRASAIHVTAEAEARQVSKWSGNAPIVTVPYVVDLTHYQQGTSPAICARAFDLPMGDHVVKLLFLSRVHPKKGVEFLVDAVAQLHRSGLNTCVVIAGPPEPAYQRDLERRVTEHGLEGMIRFVGMVRGEKKLSLYGWADLFVLPTHQENFGIVLVEALAHGTPVVTTRGTDIWRELERFGAFVVPHDASAIADAIRGAVADRQALARLGQHGQREVVHWLYPKRICEALTRMYQQA